MSYEHELSVALAALDQAARVIMEEYARFQAIADAPADISTDADRLSQSLILKHLHDSFPSDTLCAEESIEAFKDIPAIGPRIWIVDPIDGTRGFARKNGEFSIMVALVEQGKIVLGIVSEPAKHRLTYAVRGGGCWKLDGDMSGEPGRASAQSKPISCRVNSSTSLTEATLVQSHSRNPEKPSRYVKALQPARVIETYSAGIKLAMVARGEADIYLNTYDAFHDWDICAGHILVDEAGGRVTGLGGQELRYGLPGAWQRHGVLASNGKLHDASVKALASI